MSYVISTHIGVRLIQIGSILSMYGCYKYHNKIGIDGTDIEKLDTEYGSQIPIAAKHMGENAEAEQPSRQVAEFWEYVFQIIFQVYRDSMKFEM